MPPFLLRVLLLLLFLAVVAAVEKALKGDRAVRWKEYLILLTLGLLGSVAGILHDQIAVTISPEYYLGEHFGLYAGALIGAVAAGRLIKKPWKPGPGASW